MPDWFQKYRKLIVALAVVLMSMYFLGLFAQNAKDGIDKSHKQAVTYSDLVKRANAGEIAKIQWNPNTFEVKVTNKKKTGKTRVALPYLVTVPGNQAGLNNLLAIAKTKNITISSLPLAGEKIGPGAVFMKMLPQLLVMGILVFFLFKMMPIRKYKTESAKSVTTFDDVAGCNEAIVELEDVRRFLANPEQYRKLGARVPKGVLLYGPPGTGKTLLAKAIANEADIPFFQASGSEFVEMYAGLGAKKIRDLFKDAMKAAPAIIFIDEIDAVGSKRTSGEGGGGREADQTLNQLLKEMDGFKVSENPIIVIGATNRIETLDTALTRSGRLDRHIAIDPPDREGRYDILKIHSKKKIMAADVDLKTMALHSAGMSGADLETWLNEAALIGARQDHLEISAKDVDDALMRILAGAKKENRVLSDEERKKVAYHEAGHAILGEQLESANKVHKISIIPRGRSGGQTISLSERDMFLHTRKNLEDQIIMLMGGQAAEIHEFGEASSGASDDLKRASEIAMNMLTKLGMGDSIGLLVESESVTMSQELRDKIDGEARTILEDLYARAEA